MTETLERGDAITQIEKEKLKSEFLKQQELLKATRKTRQQINLELVDGLKQIIQEHPDLRFGQIIISFFLGENPETFFYDEPGVTKANLLKNLNNIHNI